MNMLPVCSATTCCSSHSQIWIHGGLRPSSGYWRACEFRCSNADRLFLGLPNGVHTQGAFHSQSATSLYCNYRSGSVDIISRSSFQNQLEDIKYELLANRTYQPVYVNEADPVATGGPDVMQSSIVSGREEELVDFSNNLIEDNIKLPSSANPQSITTLDAIQDGPSQISESLNVNTDSLSDAKPTFADIFAEVNKSISDSVNRGETALNNSIDKLTSAVKSALGGATEAIDNAADKATSTFNETGELTGDRLTTFSNDLKEVSGRVGIIAIDALRKTIVKAEDSLAKGASFVVYAYGSVKEQLPPEIQDALNLSEAKAEEVLRPVGTAFHQAYIALEGLEQSVGLNPNDPVLQFVLFVGASATLWGFYWVLTYAGYAGDLSPTSTLELLAGKENAVLIDIRPEDLRERDGIPDLRRAARFRYVNVTLPEVEGSVRKLVKGGRDLDDSLLAIVVRNLKIVRDRFKVIIMDADGTRSKGVARSLRKLGVKESYLVQGGFRSWVKEGLRIKELKPETTFSILNEEAEAIIEEIKPTPLKVIGFGVGSVAAAYALLEWEKTLQLIGVVGLGQTIYRRLASYEDSEDFKQDVRQLLAPVKIGGQAITWAAGKLDANRNGLPTSPSSVDVQNRVLQAAAKHESQPEDGQDPSSELAAPAGETADLSEA